VVQKLSWNPFRHQSDGSEENSPTKRGVALVAGALLLVVIAFGCWLAYEGFSAKSNLEGARTSAQHAKDALLQGNSEEAARWVGESHSQAQDARDATHSLPWNAISAIPWVGSPFKSGQQISDVVLNLAADVLQPSASVAAAISPDRVLKDGRVDVNLLRDAEPQLSEIASAAERLDADADAISEPAYIGAIRDARAQLQAQISDVSGLLENTALAARLLPMMLGADGPRTYFMGFQTNAEARATGGLLGGFGVLRFDNGLPIVDKLGSNVDFYDTTKFAPIDLGAEYNAQYGFTNPTTDFRNSNLSPHFPYAAQIWKSLWAQSSGTNVDGVIAIDPVALSYVLGAIGSVTMPDGEQITKENVVELTESTVYARFPTDQIARKQYLQDVANEVVKRMTGRLESPRALLDALGKAVSQGRIAVWSSAPADQELLEKTPLAHVVPDVPSPYAAVVVNNLGGNKLDYYLKPEIRYTADGCDGETRKSTVTVRLSNAVPDGPLPAYVASSQGLQPGLPISAPDGTNVASVLLFATAGAKIERAHVDTKRVPVYTGMERGHPIFEIQVSIPPGKTGEIEFELREPTAPGAPRAPVQPFVDNITPVVSVPECSG
jgi:hypothetical protein